MVRFIVDSCVSSWHRSGTDQVSVGVAGRSSLLADDDDSLRGMSASWTRWFPSGTLRTRLVEETTMAERRLPIKLDSTANGEFAPVPLPAAARHARTLAHEAIDDAARRVGLDRRAY